MKTHVFYKILFSLLIILLSNVSYSQQVLTVDNTIPTGNGNYATLDEAITYVNSLGTTTQSITVNVTAGQVFNEELSAVMVLASAVFPVIFQKSGIGPNPVIKCPIAVPTNDGVVNIFNSSYVTFDGIDITDPTPTDAVYQLTSYYIETSNHITIKNCNISNFSKYAIWMKPGVSDIQIENNNIFFSSDFVPDPTISTIYCIYYTSASTAFTQNINALGNNIHNISSTAAAIIGIRIDNANNIISNNFISIQNTKAVTGIRLGPSSVQANAMTSKILHNTVILTGTVTGDGVCLVTFSNYATFDIKSNIFINNRTKPNFDSTQYAIYLTDKTNPIYNLDYNIYYCQQAGGFLANLGGNVLPNYDYPNLSTWQTLTGRDYHSRILNPEFVDAANGDLHLTGTSLDNFLVSGIGVPEITTDIDGELRDSEFPYAGADENITYPLNIHVNVAPNSLDFGDVYTTLYEDLTFTVYNNGVNQVIVDSILFNQLSIPFLLSSDGGLNWNDTLKNITILPSESQIIQVKFSPTSMLTYDFLTKLFLNNKQIIEIEVTGNAIPLGVQLSNYSLSYADTYINNISEIQMFTIQNTFATELTINSVNAPEGFLIRKQSTTEWLSIIPEFIITGNGTQIIEVAFQPVEQINYIDNLVVNTTIQLEVALTGRGKEMDFNITNLNQPVYNSSTGLGDYDNDGDLDIFISGYTGTGSAINIYRNDGNMNFSNTSHNITEIGNGTLKLIDIDNDNDLDLFTSGQKEFEVHIIKLYSNDNGIFTEINHNIDILEYPISDWADYDGDGDLDFVFTGADTTSMVDESYTYIYKNIGNFAFEVDTIFWGVSSGDVKWADYDKDGDQDLAFAGRQQSGLYITRIMENDNGFFIPAHELFGVRYCKLDWGDYDNDADLDLIVSGSINSNETDFLPAELRIYKNEGNGTFTTIEPEIRAVQYGDIRWVDLNKDGLLDIAMNGIYTYTHWVGNFYFNRGNDVFELSTDSIEELKYAEMQFGDLDGDLDVDMVFTGRWDYMDYRAQVFENTYPVQNTAPTAPTGFGKTVAGCSASFTWTEATDNENSQAGLNYNLRIGTQSTYDNTFCSISENSTGYRLIPAKGNIPSGSDFSIPYLPDGTYFASIQAIDNSYINSPFSNETTFTINYNTAPILTNSIPDQTILIGTPFSYQIPENLFDDIDIAVGDELTLSITLSDNSQLPEWLIFTTDNLIFTANPTVANVGTISVKVTAKDRSNESISEIFDITVSEPININSVLDSQIKIYPNPTSGILNIDLSNYKNAGLQITNILGQTLFAEKNISNNVKTIDLSNYSNGIYIINIETNNKVYTSKFILEK